MLKPPAKFSHGINYEDVKSTLTNAEKGAALLSIAHTMLVNDISADEAMSDDYDDRRLELMMKNGIDGARAVQLVGVDVEFFIS